MERCLAAFGPFIFMAALSFPVSAGAHPCENHLRSRDYREPPQLGQAKVGMVDYKLINQLLLALRSAVIDGHPLPAGFEATLAPPRRADHPVGGVVLRGLVPWPEHPLGGHLVELEVQRERLAIVAELQDLSGGRTFEAILDDESFSSVFPFQAPSGRGLLLSLGRGLEINFSRFTKIPAGE